MTKLKEAGMSGVLFLDIDGVLNSLAFAEREPPTGPMGIDPRAVNRLNKIVRATGCGIVISSTWRRLHSLDEIRSMLRTAGLDWNARIIGATPMLDYCSNGIAVASIRGDEVKEWISMTGFDGPYACLDDDSDFHPSQPLVRTTWERGLTDAEADKCIALLATPTP